MKKEKVTFTYKNGFAKTKFRNISDKHLNILKQDICREQVRRKEAELFGNSEQLKHRHGFSQKLRRFFRRLSAEITYHAENTAVNYIVGSEQACESPYIGIEDFTKCAR